MSRTLPRRKTQSDYRTLALAAALALLGACREAEQGAGLDTLSEASWPTEAFNGEAAATKSAFLGSIEKGSLDAAAAAAVFSPEFRGENLTGRARSKPRVQSGLSLADWSDTAASLDAPAFVASFNNYLSELDEVLSVEIHTWEIQTRPRASGLPGLETTEAVWILGRLADGRLREDRMYLVLDLVKEQDASWKIAEVRTRSGRTTVGPGPYFHDVTAEAVPAGYDQIGAQIYTDGGPVLADFDADADLDLFLPRLHAPARLYENDGSGHFEDATAEWGLEIALLAEGSNSGLFLDLDRDGRLDLVVGLRTRGLAVFRNEGRGFRQANGGRLAAGPGQWESLAAADYDGDGAIDIYLCNYNLIDAEHQPESYVDAKDGLPNVLLRNRGDGSFEDVTVKAGLGPGRERWSYAAAWADYDRDGDPDLLVANDYGPKGLYRNKGDGGFEEVSREVGADDFGNGMAAMWGDLDGDLWLDAYCSNMQSFAGNRITQLEHFPGTPEQRALYRRFSQGNTFLRNQGDGTFKDDTERAGLKGAFWAWGNLAFDYDADADLDVFVNGGFYTGASAKDT